MSKQIKQNINLEGEMIPEDKSLQSADKSNIYVQVSAQTRKTIDKYKDKGLTISAIIEEAIDMYDLYFSMPPELLALIERLKGKPTNSFKEEFEVIETGLKLLNERKEPEKTEDIDLWSRAREEMQMMLIGKTTFNKLIAAAESSENQLDKVIKKNTALDLILWYIKKPIPELSLEELLAAIKKIWVMANYFYLIEVIKKEQKRYHVIFKHLQNKRYSLFWLKIFQQLVQYEDLSFKCEIEGEALEESLSLTIKEVHKK